MFKPRVSQISQSSSSTTQNFVPPPPPQNTRDNLKKTSNNMQDNEIPIGYDETDIVDDDDDDQEKQLRRSQSKDGLYKLPTVQKPQKTQSMILTSKRSTNSNQRFNAPVYGYQSPYNQYNRYNYPPYGQYGQYGQYNTNNSQFAPVFFNQSSNYGKSQIPSSTHSTIFPPLKPIK